MGFLGIWKNVWFWRKQLWWGGRWITISIKGSSAFFSNNKNLQPTSGVFKKGSLWRSSPNHITSFQRGCRNKHLGKARRVTTGFWLGQALCRSDPNFFWVNHTGVQLKLTSKVRQRCWTGVSSLEHWAPHRILNLRPYFQYFSTRDQLMLW